MAEDTEESCLSEYNYFFEPRILSGKVALITGGGSGIGFTIAEVFMRHKCSTIIVGRNIARLKKSAKLLESCTGEQCLPIQMDVRKVSQVEAGVDQALGQFKKIDILVNGAAGNFLCPASNLSYNAFKTVFEIDTFGTFNVSKALYNKHFKDHGGSIINITATLHLNGVPLQKGFEDLRRIVGFSCSFENNNVKTFVTLQKTVKFGDPKVILSHAGSAKAAIEALSRHLAVEWGDSGVRVNCLAPGAIEDTEGFRRLGGKWLKNKKVLTNKIPLQRMGARRDIADAALFLASGASSYITGVSLIVDGGYTMTGGRSMKETEELMSKL